LVPVTIIIYNFAIKKNPKLFLVFAWKESHTGMVKVRKGNWN
jgi:hypothetical protein